MFKKIIKGLKDVWCGSLEFDTTPKAGSYNPVTSDGIYKAIQGSVTPANVDVIKWSDVLAAEDKSVFEERIQADIAAGIEPVLLDDADPVPRIATLSGRNTYADGQQIERFSVFRTTANENNFTEYVPGKGTSELSYLNSQLKNGVAAYDPADGLVSAHNNRNSTYTYTGSNTLDFVVSPIDGMAANFAVKITSTAATDGTVTVYKKQNGLYTPLMPSVAGGTTVEAGKTYQLTCVGDCWTLAEFEEPTQGMLTEIGGKMYKVVKIGNLYWMAENLDYNFSGLVFGQSGTSETEPRGNYYNNNSTSYEKYGILYNWIAVKYLEDNKSSLIPGWHVPTAAEWDALAAAVGGTSVAGTKLKSTTDWLSGAGTDDYGFSALPAGTYNGSFDELGSRTVFWTSTVINNSMHYRILNNAADITASFGSEKELQYSIRLVKDA